MSAADVITGQRVDRGKVQRSRDPRRQMIAAERTLWEHLRDNKLFGYRFRRQQIIDGFIVDFYCHPAKLVVEVDGSVHDTQGEADAERDSLPSAKGLRVLRFSNGEVACNLDAVLARIAATLPRRVSPAAPRSNRLLL